MDAIDAPLLALAAGLPLLAAAVLYLWCNARASGDVPSVGLNEYLPGGKMVSPPPLPARPTRAPPFAIPLFEYRP